MIAKAGNGGFIKKDFTHLEMGNAVKDRGDS